MTMVKIFISTLLPIPKSYPKANLNTFRGEKKMRLSLKSPMNGYNNNKLK
jgi:hypothetical protein